MVVCKFFLQGNCRFGEMCKFEHQLNGNRHINTSILRQQNFTPSTNIQTVGTNVDTNALLHSVANDMASAEKGGQWMLSCYTPFKEKPPFPGFDDHLFEEIRWGFYEAQSNGTVPQYCQQLNTLLQNTAMQMKLLQNPTPDIINTITSIYFSATPNATAPSTNTNSIFGQSANQNFGGTSIFAAANQKFFGAQQVPTNSVYGNDQNVYGNAANNMNQSSFAAQQQLFQEQQQFQQPHPQQFQQQHPQQPFQQQLQQQFQQQQQQPQLPQQQNYGNAPLQPNAMPLQPSNANRNIFNLNNNIQSNSIMLQNNSSLLQSASSTQSSIFGSRENTVIPFVQKPTVQDESAYSKPEDLSVEDIKQYESDSFELGKIPEKPPTVQMCI